MQDSKKALLLFQHGITLFKYQLLKTPKEEEHMRWVSYASVVGSLMYTTLYNRLDICYVMEIVN